MFYMYLGLSRGIFRINKFSCDVTTSIIKTNFRMTLNNYLFILHFFHFKKKNNNTAHCSFYVYEIVIFLFIIFKFNFLFNIRRTVCVGVCNMCLS